MTPEQAEWLAQHPSYRPVGPPRSGVYFGDHGTLYADGRFEKSMPMKAIRLERGCLLVGVPDDS